MTTPMLKLVKKYATGMVLLFAGIAFQLTSLFTSYWVELTGSDSHEGLFWGCYQGRCVTLKGHYGWDVKERDIYVVRFFIVSSLALAVTSMAFFWLFVVLKSKGTVTTHKLLRTAVVLNWISASMAIGGLYIYNTGYYGAALKTFRHYTDRGSVKLDFSFLVCIIGLSLVMCSAIAFSAVDNGKIKLPGILKKKPPDNKNDCHSGNEPASVYTISQDPLDIGQSSVQAARSPQQGPVSTQAVRGGSRYSEVSL